MHKGAFSPERQRSHLVETQDDSVSVYARFQIRCERVMNARGYRLEPHRQARWQRGVSHCITRQEDHAAYKKMHAHPPRGRVYQSNDILQGEIVYNACSYSRGSGLWESPLLSHQQSLWKLICLFLHIRRWAWEKNSFKERKEAWTGWLKTCFWFCDIKAVNNF